jgi:nitrite reductase/ring-hydroxylating ferredoxin subunit
MKLVMLTRREVCGGLAACVGAVVISGCGGDSGNGAVDAPPDSTGSGGACGTSATDVGAPSMFTANKPVYFSAGNFFVVRDSGGLYALTARCTHEGATTVIQTSDFYCPRHGAMFDFNGTVTRGPAVSPLVHFAMCMLANGHVGVTTSMSVAATQRLNA